MKLARYGKKHHFTLFHTEQQFQFVTILATFRFIQPFLLSLSSIFNPHSIYFYHFLPSFWILLSLSYDCRQAIATDFYYCHYLNAYFYSRIYNVHHFRPMRHIINTDVEYIMYMRSLQKDIFCLSPSAVTRPYYDFLLRQKHPSLPTALPKQQVFMLAEPKRKTSTFWHNIGRLTPFKK